MNVRGPVAALAVILALVPSAGCSQQDPYADEAALARAAQQRLLDQRARAIRTGDLQLFLRGIAREDTAFVARQRRYFADLTELPLAKVRYRVLAGDWPDQLLAPRWGPDAQLPRVRMVTQLDGYDDKPVRSLVGFAFARRDGHWRIVSDRTRSGDFFPGYQPKPWDVAAIDVIEQNGVLALFDDGTAARTGALMSVVADAVDDVQAALPFAWDGRVVLYAFAEPEVLRSFENVPGGNIEHLGALTFPVYADDEHEVPAGMRFTLLPSSVRAGQPFLGRIVRHELTHVALGERDDGAPVWFAEGLAEYVGARPLSRTDRRIASVALTRAGGKVDRMPSSHGFNGPDQDWHYALSWMACDYIADTRGEAMLWRLMDALHRGGAGTPDDRQDTVVRAVLGYDTHELARRAAARIRSIYG